jgi:hypothetical protein
VTGIIKKPVKFPITVHRSPFTNNNPEKEQPLLNSKNDHRAEVVLPEGALYFLNLIFLASINRKK